jgi:L-serine/L-threonine ammonia-lyase
VLQTLKGNLLLVAVVGVETEGAASFNASFKARQHISIPVLTSAAKSLGAKKISKMTFDLFMQHPGHVNSLLVTDAQAAMGAVHFAGTIPPPSLCIMFKLMR